jgi:hypothetical protein
MMDIILFLAYLHVIAVKISDRPDFDQNRVYTSIFRALIVCVTVP